MDVTALVEEAWKRFVGAILPCVLFALVGVALCLTIVLVPAVGGGFVRGFVGLVRDGRPPELAELWCFERYLDMALVMLVVGVLTSLGYMLFIVPGVVLSVWWLYAGFFVADRGLGVADAMAASRAAVARTGFMYHLAILVIVWVLGILGGSLVALGALLTTPLALTLLATVYVRVVAPNA